LNKRICHTVLLFILPLILIGQIVVDQSSLPDFGDTISYKTDRNPDVQNLDGGEDMLWDFSQLSGPYVDIYTFGGIDSQDEFHSQLDMILKKNDHAMSLLRWQGDDLLELGRYQDGLIQGQVSDLATYSSPALLRKGKIEMGMVDQNEFLSSLVWSTNDLPLMLINDLPDGVDSVRLQIQTTINQSVDAWGTIRMPYAAHDALRIRHQTDTQSDFSIYSDGRWYPFNSERLMNQFFTTTTNQRIAYHYYTAESKLPMIKVEMADEETILEIHYQIDQNIERNAQAFNIEKGLFAYPNPTFGNVRFDFFGYDPGRYTITIYNTILKELWSESFQIDQNKTVDLDFSHLHKGSYYYAIKNASEERLLIKKLNIIKP